MHSIYLCRIKQSKYRCRRCTYNEQKMNAVVAGCIPMYTNCICKLSVQCTVFATKT